MIVITIDTLRADHVGTYGYFRDTTPRLDEFADQALVFDQAFSGMATTLPAHTSLFTGLAPLEHGVLANTTRAAGGSAFRSSGDVRLFAEMAHDAGWETSAFVSATPLEEHCGLAEGFDVYAAPEGFERLGEETVDLALAELARPVRGPRLLWLHLYDPHADYSPPAGFDLFETDAEFERWLTERAIPDSVLDRGRRFHTRSAINRYNGEVRYADAQVGRFLDALRASSWWDSAAVVIVADHGEGLGQHDWRQHGGIFREQLQVPLIVRFPGEGGPRGRTAVPTELRDVLATVLLRLDPALAEPFAAQATGIDVLAGPVVPRALVGQRTGRDLGSEIGPLYALTNDQWRFHHRPDEGDALFARDADPHELANLLEQRPEVADELRGELLRILGEQRTLAEQLGFGDASRASLDESILSELEALGYTEE
ncbi:Arylsulfatase [Planctomycetes bacterium Pla86]|uniref:Arylsulfatase n=1 Tax=Engelhardtia mirabilis TaxID=2528011 RepID=A0A518BGD4_9BACT|nr:Arylsulfatase [Planctomycetes bacterium Pla133]QDV00376.1 Arylsulfatase [Planctomycetes bacterium Pla86]